MRVLIDAMGAPEDSGGMNVYARELIASWAEAYVDDELIVVAGPWADKAFADNPNVAVHAVVGRATVTRTWTQLVMSGVRYRVHRAEALLSVTAIASPLVPARRRAVTIHDWRHRTRPAEFGAAQRMYRGLWRISVRRAGTTIAISEKTGHETLRFAGARRLVVVENGGDHPRRWPAVERRTDGSPTVLTYGHLPNKRPEAVIRAMALLQDQDARLIVLGATGAYRDSLRRLAESCGVAARVDLPGFVPEADYRGLLSTAGVVVLNSSDEGFGLPVVEAEYFGIPVVAAADSGLPSIHPDRLIVADPGATSLAVAIGEALTTGGRSFPPRPSWRQTASAIREALLLAAGSRGGEDTGSSGGDGAGSSRLARRPLDATAPEPARNGGGRG